MILTFTVKEIKFNKIGGVVVALSVVPCWTREGIIPPNDIENPVGENRSPYKVGIVDFIDNFSISPKRKLILDGFLRFRKELYTAGVTKGFQWVDGSFLEYVEELENRSPNDIDIVTFADIPDNLDQNTLFKNNEELFSPERSRETYLVDSYFVQLNNSSPERLIQSSCYWYSVWSHRRYGQWKGFLRVNLSPDEDERALEKLQTVKTWEEEI